MDPLDRNLLRSPVSTPRAHETFRAAGVGFVWVTDGLGWQSMQNPLREAFGAMDWLVNIKLASKGMLEAAVRIELRT